MKKKSWKLRTGIILIILSFLPFCTLPVIPFLDLESKLKIAVSTVLFVMGEVLFWSGGLLVGKELFTKYKSYLNPRNWFQGRPGKEKKSNDL